MAPPTGSTLIDAQTPLASVEVDLAPRRGRQVSYSSIATIVSVLDIVLIVIVSITTGLTYNLIAHEGDADIVRLGLTGIVVGATFVLVSRDRGLYDPIALMDWASQARNIITVWILIFFVFAGGLFALKIGKEFSRGAVFSLVVTGLTALIVHHALWRVLIQRAIQGGKLRGRKSILLCMHELSDEVRVFHGAARSLAPHGFQIAHCFNLHVKSPKEVIDHVVATARGSDIEEILFVADLQRWKEVEGLAEQLRVLPLPVTFLPDERTAPLLRNPFRHFGTTVGVEVQRPPLSATERFWKRLIDVTCALCGLVILMPMLAIVAITIKLDSKGPILFTQTRYGFNNKRFKILKFRTMSVLEDGSFIKQAVLDDKRVTRVGLWLRRTSIDELPQLLNVLIGDMSIVGPRPHATVHDDYYADLIGEYAFRHHVKPGITGWAQIQGYRGETPTVDSMKQRVDLDIWYVNNWSPLLDIMIILRTTVEVVRGRNAY